MIEEIVQLDEVVHQHVVLAVTHVAPDNTVLLEFSEHRNRFTLRQVELVFQKFHIDDVEFDYLFCDIAEG